MRRNEVILKKKDVKVGGDENERKGQSRRRIGRSGAFMSMP